MLLACLLLVFIPQFTAVSGATLTFAPGWKSTTSEISGNFSFTDTLGLALTITLPLSTTSITYTGLKRTGGSIYGVCLDCTTTSKLQEISGHDATLTNNADAIPTTIFFANVNPDQEHILQITNIGDNSFGGESELTFVSLETTTSTASTVSSKPVISSASTSISSTTSATSSVSISTTSSTSSASASPSSAPANASSRTSANSSLIAAIAVLTVIAVLSFLIGLYFYLRNRKRNEASFDVYQVSSTMEQLAPVTSSASAGPLAMAGRTRPPTRLPDPNLYPPLAVSQDSPIFPVRRMAST